jgi:hypothetical protein
MKVKRSDYADELEGLFFSRFILISCRMITWGRL